MQNKQSITSEYINQHCLHTILKGGEKVEFHWFAIDKKLNIFYRLCTIVLHDGQKKTRYGTFYLDEKQGTVSDLKIEDKREVEEALKIRRTLKRNLTLFFNNLKTGSELIMLYKTSIPEFPVIMTTDLILKFGFYTDKFFDGFFTAYKDAIKSVVGKCYPEEKELNLNTFSNYVFELMQKYKKSFSNTIYNDWSFSSISLPKLAGIIQTDKTSVRV